MTFSQYAGVAIVPTLARIVLAAVFIPVGWNKVFNNADFTVEEATQLRALNVTVDPAPPKVISDATGVIDGVEYRFALASSRSQTPPADAAPGTLREPPAGEGDAKPPAATPPAATPPAPDAAGSAASPIVIDPNPQQPLAPGTYTAQALHKLTLMLHENGFPEPVWMARLAAFTELIGGAMLLLGLFSRIWGLGLSIAMGVAFYLVSMKMNGIFTMDPRVFAAEPMRSSTAYIQLALFVLAFGVMLTGAGPLSLDRMLFGGGGEDLDPGEVKMD